MMLRSAVSRYIGEGNTICSFALLLLSTRSFSVLFDAYVLV